MKEDFLEKILSMENEEKRLLINKMSKLLDQSIEDFINLRERQTKNDSDVKSAKLNKSEVISIQGINEIHNNNNDNDNNNDNNNNDNNNNNNGQVRNDILNHFSRHERLERIRIMEEENENLDRLIENDNMEVIG